MSRPLAALLALFLILTTIQVVGDRNQQATLARHYAAGCK